MPQSVPLSISTWIVFMRLLECGPVSPSASPSPRPSPLLRSRRWWGGRAAPSAEPERRSRSNRCFPPRRAVFEQRMHDAYQVISRRDKSDLFSLGILPLNALEVGSDCRRTSDRLPRGFCEKSSHRRGPLPRDVPHSVHPAGLVLGRDQSKVAADGLAVREAVRIVQKRHDGSAVRIPTPGMLRS
jgi:hypothetical protein